MKVIITGATGFTGGEVLQQCLKNPSISSIVALSRRPLPEALTAGSTKLKTVLLQDFELYPEDVLKELAGAEACIWALGTAHGRDQAFYRQINLLYTLAGANTYATKLAPQLGKDRKFRFIYTSGALVERDQTKPMWFLQENRRLRGEVEIKLVEAGEQYKDAMDVFIVRPGVIRAKGSILGGIVGMLGPSLTLSIRVDELACTMVDLALNGGDEQCLENTPLALRGQQLLSTSQ